MTPTIACVINDVRVISDFCRSFLCMNDPTNEIPTSVEFAEARPNNYNYIIVVHFPITLSLFASISTCTCVHR